MSEQQKGSDVVSAASTSAIPTTNDQVSTGTPANVATESDKPKRRSASSTKTAPEADTEVAKPNNSRTSRRVAKAKDGQSVSQPDGQSHGEAGQARGSSPGAQDVDLPPLPPAPVPTPGGIAFMQQHVAYQDALQKRSELRLERLQRQARTSKGNALPTEREPGVSEIRSEDRKAHEIKSPGSTPSVDHKPAKPARIRPGKAGAKNSIEAGPDVRKEPFTETDLQVLHDAEDARLLRQLLERSRALREPGGSFSTDERIPEIAQSDVRELRSIKDVVARKLGLSVAAQSRQLETAYKVEFDTLAPELRQEAEEGGIRQPDVVHSASTSMGKQAVASAPAPNAIPDWVRTRFLNIDNDYYFPDRSPAFVDRGAKLATRGEHPEVVCALVDIAKERGWNSVTVKGTETFRRAAWMEAARNGMQVSRYKPTELDLAQVQQREPNNSIEAGSIRQQAKPHMTSLEKPAEHSADGGFNEKLSAFANERPTLAVKKYPELIQAYALLDAARKFAEAHIPGHEDQFVAIGKALVTQQLREGREVIGPKVYPDEISQSRTGHQSNAKGAEDKALVRER